MPGKTGLSHAGAAFSTILVSTAVERYVEEFRLLELITMRAADIIVTFTGGSIPGRFAGPLVIATGLSFLWGIGYHWRRFSRVSGS